MTTTPNDSAPLPPDKFPVAVANIRGSVDFAQEAMILSALRAARRTAFEEVAVMLEGHARGYEHAGNSGMAWEMTAKARHVRELAVRSRTP